MVNLIEFGYMEVYALSSTDLQAAIDTYPGTLSYAVTPFDRDGYPNGRLEVCAVIDERRIGIAQGADASWGDWDGSPDDIEQAISDYLNDSDAWERRA